MDSWGQDTGQHDNNQREDEEDDEQDPRPPPPAPTPRPSGPSHPRKLKQHWGSSALGRGNHVPMDAARESKEDVFVRPSSLQEPSLWSTAMEQQALELKMKEVVRPRASTLGVYYLLFDKTVNNADVIVRHHPSYPTAALLLTLRVTEWHKHWSCSIPHRSVGVNPRAYFILLSTIIHLLSCFVQTAGRNLTRLRRGSI